MITSTVDISGVTVCSGNQWGHSELWLDIFMLLLSSFVFCLNVRSIVRRAKLAHSIRGQNLVNANATQSQVKTAMSSCGKFRVFVPNYFVTIIFGCILLMYHSTHNIFGTYFFLVMVMVSRHFEYIYIFNMNSP